MVDITNQKLGGTGTGLALGESAVRSFTSVLDIKSAVADGLTSGDNIEVMSIPDGAYFMGIDAEITEALVLGGSNAIFIGTTDGAPVEYVNNQTDTAVGRFTAYAAAAVTPVINIGEKKLLLEVNGAAITSGKITITAWYGRPATQNVETAKPRVYPNS